MRGGNRSSLELRAEEALESLAVLRELADTLVELVGRHLVLAQCPAELGLVVNVRDLGNRVGALGWKGAYAVRSQSKAQDVDCTYPGGNRASWGQGRCRS